MKRSKQPAPASGPAMRTLPLIGDLTIYTVAAVKSALMSELAAGSQFAIDLSQVGEIDTAGLQLLIFAKREADRLNKSMSVVAPSATVSSLLDLCNARALCAVHAGAQTQSNPR
jgi:anti-sigma B factor antagonist